MKILWLATLTLASATIASAQFERAQVFDIPMTVHVGGRLVPAGTYTVRWHGDIIMLVSADAKAGGMVIANRTDTKARPGKAELVLNKYPSGDFFVSKIVTDEGGLEAVKTRAEREHVQSTVRAQAYEKVILTARANR